MAGLDSHGIAVSGSVFHVLKNKSPLYCFDCFSLPKAAHIYFCNVTQKEERKIQPELCE